MLCHKGLEILNCFNVSSGVGFLDTLQPFLIWLWTIVERPENKNIRAFESLFTKIHVQVKKIALFNNNEDY